MQSCLVSTSETTRIRFFMDLLIAKQKPVMLVGSAGSGKTVSVAAKLNSLPDSYAITNVPFNFYTTSGRYLDIDMVSIDYEFFTWVRLGAIIQNL